MKQVHTLLLAGLAAASPVERRQAKDIQGLLGGLGKQLGGLLSPPKITAMKVENLKPTFPGDDVKRVKMTYGPFKLKAANSTKREGNFFSLDPQGTAWVRLASDFPTDITILHSNLAIHFANGEKISNANGVYDHHAFVIDASRKPEPHIGCAGSASPIMPINSLMGSSSEAAGDIAQGGVDLNVRPITGSYVGKGHVVALQGDLVNYNNRTEEVYMTTDFSYVDGRSKGIWETAVHLVPVGVCSMGGGKGIAALAPPKGAKKWTHRDDGIEMKDDGKLIYLRGHMHDGSVNMLFKLNGKDACDSRTEYKAAAIGSAAAPAPMGGAAPAAPGGHSHGAPAAPSAGGHGHGAAGMSGGMSAGTGGEMMSSTSTCTDGTDYKKGDKLYIEANYDLDLHPLREFIGGGMSDTMALGVVITGKQL